MSCCGHRIRTGSAGFFLRMLAEKNGTWEDGCATTWRLMWHLPWAIILGTGNLCIHLGFLGCF